MNEIVKNEQNRCRGVAGQIRQGIRDYFTTLALIKKAWDEEHWRVLGYDNWQGYVDGEFGAERLQLPAEYRQKAIVDLRLAGMSQRAIGAALGIPQSAVRDELSGSTHLPGEVKGADGKTYAATRPQTPAPSPEPGPETSTSAGPGHTPPAATGEADARLDAPHVASEAPTGVGASVGAGDPLPAHLAGQIQQRIQARQAPDPLDDPEFIAAQQRQISSENVAKGLVALHFSLDSDPLRWFAEMWQPTAYRERDLPRVRDAFTVSGLRSIAKNLDTLADHLDTTGGAL